MCLWYCASLSKKRKVSAQREKQMRIWALCVLYQGHDLPFSSVSASRSIYHIALVSFFFTSTLTVTFNNGLLASILRFTWKIRKARHSGVEKTSRNTMFSIYQSPWRQKRVCETRWKSGPASARKKLNCWEELLSAGLRNRGGDLSRFKVKNLSSRADAASYLSPST